MRRISVERRGEQTLKRHLVVAVVGVAMGLFAGFLILLISGHPAFDAYEAMWNASFGTPRGLEATLVKTTPLILTGLAVALALRLNLWNIGAEGQLAMGAVGATLIGLNLGSLPAAPLILLMLVAGACFGAAWALVAAVPRALIGLNEIITTLFLNYIALLAMSALILGPWQDQAAIGFAYSRPLPTSAELPTLGDSRVSTGLLIALLAVILLWWLVQRTRWGFAVRIAGGNPNAARYLKLPLQSRILGVFAISGALAGIAGVIEVSSVTFRLQDGITADYGYAGILIAFLARGSLLAVVLVALLYGALLTGGFALQATGVPSSIALVIQALIIIFVLVGEWLGSYGMRFIPGKHTAPPPAGSKPVMVTDGAE
jgi:simple sugar transport system permease protein